MKYSDFKRISNNIILSYYDDLKKIDNDNYNGDILYLKKINLCKTFFYYEKYRKLIRSSYMLNGEKPMDRHKIASTFMCSMLKSNFIKINKTKYKYIPLKLLLANEYVSFFVAINIIELYRRDDLNNYNIIFPETYIEKENYSTSYIENTCKALHYIGRIDVGKILAYANSFFLLEKYTDEHFNEVTN